MQSTAFNAAESSEYLLVAREALARYKLRTSLSVLGVVLGVAAVIAMMSVSDGARREALRQVEALGLDNLVARTHVSSAAGLARGLAAADGQRLESFVPLAQTTTPLLERFVRVTRDANAENLRVLGVRSTIDAILRLTVDRGRFLTANDDRTAAAVCVLGANVARLLFGFADPLHEHVRIGDRTYQVAGVLRAHGVDPQSSRTLAWRNLDEAVMVPIATLSGRTLDVDPNQPVDEIWLRLRDGERVAEQAAAFERGLARLHGGRRDFDVVVPRELLAQRYRTQQTFSVVVGSVAALALIVGGIGIMNIMLTSVVERTHEIGIRRTVGASRRHIALQFLVEALLMTVSGGIAGVALGAIVSGGITAYAGWPTSVSPQAIVVALGVSFVVGVVFGWYPAVKAAHLEPADAMRYE